MLHFFQHYFNIFLIFKTIKKSFFPDHALHEGLDDVRTLVVVEEEVDDHAPKGSEVDIQLAIGSHSADQEYAGNQNIKIVARFYFKSLHLRLDNLVFVM